MTTDAYDEDRLPWLNDTPSVGAGAPVQRLPGGVIYRRGFVLMVIFIALLAGIMVVLTTLGTQPLNEAFRRPSTQTEDLRVTTDPLPIREIEGDYQGPSSGVAQSVAQRDDQVLPTDQQLGPEEPNPGVSGALPTRVVELQLGAYRNHSDAVSGWRYLSNRFPLARAYPEMVVSPLSGEDSLFRLRLLMPTEEEASALCGQIQRGGQECFLVR